MMPLRVSKTGTLILAIGVCFAAPCGAQDPTVSALRFDPWDTQNYVGQRGTYITPTQQFPLPDIPAPIPHENIWTLPALTNWALSHNPQTEQAWAALRASADALGIAKGLWLPTVSLQAQDQVTQTKYFVNGVAPILSRTTYDSLNITEVVYDFGQRQASIAESKAAVWVAQYQSDAVIQQVVQNVTQAYYANAYAQKSEADLAQSVADAKKLVETTRMLYLAHLHPITDLQQAQVLLERVRQQWILAKGSMLAAQGYLAQVAGMSVDQVLKTTQISTLPEQIPSDIKTLLDQALKQNPNLLANSASVMQAVAALDLAKAQGRPSLSLVANTQSNIPHTGVQTQTTSIMLQLAIPIDANFVTNYQIGQQQDLVSQAKAQVQIQAATIELAVWQTFQTMQSSWQAYQSDLVQVNNAKLTVTGIRSRYRMGLATILDVITAEQNLTSAELSEEQDLTNTYQYLAILYAYVGIAPTLN